MGIPALQDINEQVRCRTERTPCAFEGLSQMVGQAFHGSVASRGEALRYQFLQRLICLGGVGSVGSRRIQNSILCDRATVTPSATGPLGGPSPTVVVGNSKDLQVLELPGPEPTSLESRTRGCQDLKQVKGKPRRRRNRERSGRY